MSAAAELAGFGLAVALVAAAVLAALVATRLSERLPLPAPALFLLAAAAAAHWLEPLDGLVDIVTAERVATAAIIVILLDGGLHIGTTRLRASLRPVLLLGVPGTFAVAAVIAAATHWAFRLDWSTAALLGAALSPTDPATVFSVLGRREIAGRSGTILEGEAGANDPVGIALMLGVLAFVAEADASAWRIGAEFAYSLVAGVLLGIGGGIALARITRTMPLPAAGMYPVRVLVGGAMLFGVGSAIHASGFLAVFAAGVVLGDASMPFRAEIVRFHKALASLAEIVVFVILGLTIGLADLDDAETWLIGLGTAAIVIAVARPVVVWPLLAGADLDRGERIFVTWAGLKGAVPILLAALAVLEEAPDAGRVYGIVFIVVASTVIVQGGTIGPVADRLRVPMRVVPPAPWGLEVRLAHEPTDVERRLVEPGSPADRTEVRALALDAGTWIALIVRDGRAISPAGATRLAAGDEVVVLRNDDDDGEPGPDPFASP